MTVAGRRQTRGTLQLVRMGVDGEKMLARLKLERVNHGHLRMKSVIENVEFDHGI